MTLSRLSALLTLLSGIVMSFLSFFHPPGGEIAQSVLFYFGQCLVYAGAVFGVKILLREEVRRQLSRHAREAKPADH